MRKSSARRKLLIATPVMVVVLSALAFAWACTALATLDLGVSSAAPTTVINGQGFGFSYMPTSSDVRVYWSTTSGTALTSVKPLDILLNGRVAKFSFAVPQAAAGYYVVIATQYDVFGTPIAGTPARATLQVL